MKIAIGSKNEAKNNGVKNVFERIWNDNVYVSIGTNSGVSDQPLSSEEAIDGAINRAKEALSKNEGFDFGVGLEGTVDSNKHGMFLLGWVAIVDKNGKIGIGSSGAVVLPDWMKAKIEDGMELGPLVQEMMNDEDNKIRHTLGASGLLTDGMYGRIKEFEDAVVCALAKFVGFKYYC